MNKLGIFVNFWEKSWTINYPYYIDKVARLGYDILEFQAQPLLEMSDEECRAIRRHAGEDMALRRIDTDLIGCRLQMIKDESAAVIGDAYNLRSKAVDLSLDT